MVWLANYNAGPISAVYNSDGTPRPVASNVSIAGHSWLAFQSISILPKPDAKHTY
jgi:hypothetical protein